MDLPKADEESLAVVPNKDTLQEIGDEKQIDDEPAKKKPKVEEQDDTLTPEHMPTIDQQQVQQELEPEPETQSQPEVESELHPEGTESQEVS